jgi:hypothetical protein
MGHIVFVDVGVVISVDTLMVTWTFVSSIGLDPICGVAGHRHKHVLLLVTPGSPAGM